MEHTSWILSRMFDKRALQKTEHTRQELNEAHRDGDSDGRQK